MTSASWLPIAGSRRMGSCQLIPGGLMGVKRNILMYRKCLLVAGWRDGVESSWCNRVLAGPSHSCPHVGAFVFLSISSLFLKHRFPSFSMEGKYKKNLKSKSTHQCCWTINGPVCPYTFNLPTGELKWFGQFSASSLSYAIKFRYHVCRIKNKNHETICSTDKNWKYIAS